MRYTRHPGERLLNRFADGELGDRDHARVSAHLARCPRCREEVALTRRLGDVARSLPAPLATDEILRRALERRRAGERVLLPMSDAGAPRQRRVNRMIPAAAAAVVTLMVASLILSVGVLEADRPALRFHPERPAAGEALRVDYTGGTQFAGETHLALRARFRTADDRRWQLLAGVLVRGDDGLYRTEVQLPDSVVYAAFAVEDLHGREVDSNNRELWDLMVHGDDDRPTLDAMTARTWDLERRDWGEAYAQTLRMTEAYPDEPQAWAARFSYELSLFERDSVFAAHRAHYARLEDRLAAAPDPDPSAMAWLGMYALDLGEMDEAEAWIGRARVREPRNWAAATGEARMLVALPERDLMDVVEALESLWQEIGGGHRRLAHVAWRVSLALSDEEGIRRWSERYLRERPFDEIAQLPNIFAAPTLREELIGRVRRFVDGQAWHELERPLHLNRAEHLRTEAALLQQALAEMASAALESGATAHASVLANLAVGLAWESHALVSIGRVLAALRDSPGSFRALARAAADPAVNSSSFAASSGLDEQEFVRAVSAAQSAMREHVMQDAVTRHLPSGLRVSSEDGAISFTEIRENRPTVVVYLSRYCMPALDDAKRMADLHASLDGFGADLIVVSIDNTAALDAYLLEAGYAGPVYRDHTAALRTAFFSSQTPDFFVLDAAGRIRFEHSQMDDVLRQVWLLQETSSLVVASTSE